jgi:hypothetical protein
MDNIYLIGGICLHIKYHYDDFFQHNLESYKSNQERYDHAIEVHIVDINYFQKSSKHKNQTIITIQEGIREINAYNHKGEIKGKIKHDLLYTHVDIYIVSDIISNPAEIEYTLMGMIFLEIAQKYGYLAWHASAIIHKNKAILISAPSQTGKSTHAKLWCEVFRETYILNDDKPLMKYIDGKFMIYSSPFSGKDTINVNEVKELKGIVFINKGQENDMIVLSDKDKLKHIMRNIFKPNDESTWEYVSNLITNLMKDIPILMGHITKDQSSVLKVYEALYKE